MSDVIREKKSDDQDHDHDDHGHSTVTIVVNGAEYAIHRGRRTVAEIKSIAQVPAAHELALMRGEQDLERLPDDGSLVIKGGEQFLSYPKDSGSS